MNDSLETVNEMRAVTISREYGSGGGEIAARLAQRLGWQVIDHAIVERVARALGTSQEEAEAHDEHTEGVLARALNNLQYIDPAFAAYAPPGAVPSDEAYRDAVERIVRAAAARGHVVIVGRGAQALLAERRDVLRVRIIAPLGQRIAYVMQREGLDQRAAASRILQKEHERTRYLEAEYHRKPEDAHLYDMVLNTSSLDPASAVNVICLALNHKARRLCAQAGGGGPAAGQSRSPGQPRDFRPPVRSPPVAVRREVERRAESMYARSPEGGAKSISAAQAVEKLIRAYGKLVFHTIYGLTGDWEESQDLTQDTFLQAVRAIDAARAHSGADFHAKAWLLRIAVNTARMRLRRTQLMRFIPFSRLREERQEETGTSTELLSKQADPVQPAGFGAAATGDPAEVVAERDAVRRAMAQLPEAQRLCLLLSVVDGFSSVEIAHMLDIGEAAVRQRLARARKQFQRIYARGE